MRSNVHVRKYKVHYRSQTIITPETHAYTTMSSPPPQYSPSSERVVNEVKTSTCLASERAVQIV